jgi:hypothetical protein
MEGYPRIRSVAALPPQALVVSFENGLTKRYDCAPLLRLPAFALLRSPAFFRSVRVDPGGYGVSWNDDLDLSEAELWSNGVDEDSAAHP